MKSIAILCLAFFMAYSAQAQVCHAKNDTVKFLKNNQSGIYVLLNDSCQQACLSNSTSTQHGSLILTQNGVVHFFHYNPYQDFAGSDAFKYNIIDCNTNSIIDSASVYITVADSIFWVKVLEISNTNPNVCSGSVNLDIRYGTPPYTIRVNGNQVLVSDSSHLSVPNLCAGMYSLLVTDNLGRNYAAGFSICNAFLAVIVYPQTVSQTVTCGSSENAVINGGVPPYTLTWSNGSTTNPAYNLCYGNNSITVVDAIGSQVVTSFFIQPPPLTSNDSIQHTSPCACTGKITIRASGGFPPYTYVWGIGSISDNISNLCPGSYFYTVKDSLGFTYSHSVTILSPYHVTVQTLNELMNNCNGSISLIPTGGCEPYSYAWGGGQTTSTISNLCSGNYYYTVTDSSGISFSDTVTVHSVSQCAFCNTASPFCTGTTYSFPLSTNTGNAEPGPNYGCLATQPNPAWYFMMIEHPGDLTIHLESPTGQDVDFACWGPFESQGAPCNGLLTASCTTCPNNTVDSSFYPSGNLVDCSYANAATENCHISNGLTGQFYMLMITNFSNVPTNIVFSQTNIGQPNAGTASCDVFPVHVFGNVFNDVNNNSTKDTLESGIENAIIAVQNEGTYYNSDSSGNYSAHMNNGSNVVAVPFLSPYATISPNSYTITQSEVDKNFAVHFVPNINDLIITLTNVTAAMPGFMVKYKLTYYNPGTTVQSGTIKFVKSNNLTYNSSSVNIASISGDTLTWNYANLHPMEVQNITILFTLSSSTSLGTFVQNVAAISPLSNDTTPANNVDTLRQTVVGSYDPNLKEVAPMGDIFIDSTNQNMQMVYTVHFQNEGTANAITVRVEDMISNNLYLPSLQILSSSSPCELSVWGHKVNFTFNNINLVPKSVDEVGSQGFVKYGIQLISNIQPGAFVHNYADIYFDYNSAITTNTVSTLIKDVNTEVKQIGNSKFEFAVVPNPSNGQAKIYFDSKINQQASIIVTNMLGSVVYKKSQVMNGAVLDLSSLHDGMYVVKCTTDGVVSESKLIIGK